MKWVYCGNVELNGKTTFDVKNKKPEKELPKIEIIKKDEKSGTVLEGGAFRIYATFTDGTPSGWLKSTSSNIYKSDKTYVQSATNATVYGSRTEKTNANRVIERVKEGTYYIFETKAPDVPEEYDLKEQTNYRKNIPAAINSKIANDTFIKNEQWVYLDSIQVTGTGKNSIEVKNKKPDGGVEPPLGKLEIIKKDATSGAELKNAGFTIYVNSLGWLRSKTSSNIYTAEKEYVTSEDQATVYGSRDSNGGSRIIEKLEPGIYYIFEKNAPTGYNLSDQDNGLIKMDAFKSLRNVHPSDDKGIFVAWRQVKREETVTCDIKNTKQEEPKYGNLQIIKKDETSGEELKNAEFKIYADSLGWVKSIGSNIYTAKKEYVANENDATVFGAKDSTQGISGVIEKLKAGKYYIFETKAPDNYDLSYQDNWLINANAYKKLRSIHPSDDNGIFVAEIEVDENKTGICEVKNKKPEEPPYTEIEIVKVADKKVNHNYVELTAGFRLYANSLGWLKSTDERDIYGSKKEYVENESQATVYYSRGSIDNKNSKIIKKLTPGTYYLFECVAPIGYNLDEQMNFMNTDGYSHVKMIHMNDDGDVLLSVKTLMENQEEKEWLVTNKSPNGSSDSGQLEIKKVDKDKETILEGAEFKIYAKCDDDNKTEGWVHSEDEAHIYRSKKEYKEDPSEATIYSSKSSDLDVSKILENLKKGTYYIFETKAPTSPRRYALNEQNNYMEVPADVQGEIGTGTYPNTTTNRPEWVYLGKQKVEDKKKVTFEAENQRIRVNIEIIKRDQDDESQILKNGKFIIFGVLPDGKYGWVYSSNSDDIYESKKQLDQSYSNYATQFDSKQSEIDTTKTIKDLPEGTYYLFEWKAPDGYKLSEQDNYKKNVPDDVKSKINNVYFFDYEEWVYLGTAEKDNTYTIKFDVTNKKIEEKKTSIQIMKTDEDRNGRVLTGGGFKLYGVLANGTKGWVKSTGSDIYTSPKEYKASIGEATIYSSKSSGTDTTKKIANLELGTYYLFEVSPPTSPETYYLKEQENYRVKPNEVSSSDSFFTTATNEWVYLGSKTCADQSTAQFDVKNRIRATVEIMKTDEDRTSRVLTGGGFKLYGVLADGSKGWVQSTSSSNIYTSAKTYVTNITSATQYESKSSSGDTSKTIQNLKDGTYYLFETKAPTSPETYYLKEQENYRVKPDAVSSGDSFFTTSTNEWVYLGSISRTSSHSLAFGVKNRIRTTVEIMKTDEDRTSRVLTGGGFKIYGVLANGSKGWVQSTSSSNIYTSAKTYVTNITSATQYESKSSSGDTSKTIQNLKDGTYYLFETKAPTSPETYYLKEQKNYRVKPDAVSSGDSFFTTSTNEWVYLGGISRTSSHSLKFDVKNRILMTVEIMKTDEDRTSRVLTGGSFKIYGVLANGSKGWVHSQGVGNIYTAEKEYVDKIGSATVYESKSSSTDTSKTIQNLKDGTYYLFETKAPTSPEQYYLKEQENYRVKPNEVSSADNFFTTSTSEWVYLGGISRTTSHKIEKKVTNRILLTIELMKKDEDIDTKILTDGGFKLYGVLANGNKGWVQSTGGNIYTSTKTYVSNISNATEFGSKSSSTDTSKTIQNLKDGTYYLFETKAPTDYYLEEQENYRKVPSGIQTELQKDSFFTSTATKWVYLDGKARATGASHTVEFNEKNRIKITIELMKKDEDIASKILTDGEFKIYAVLKNGKTGWVQSTNTSNIYSSEKTYVQSMTSGTAYRAKSSTTDTTKKIENLKDGTYYLFETKAPTDYFLNEQRNYRKNIPSAISTQLANDTFIKNNDWVYLDGILRQNNTSHTVQFNETNRLKIKIDIMKKDYRTSEILINGGFKIYAKLKPGITVNGLTEGWVKSVSGDIYSSDTKTYVSDPSQATVYGSKISETDTTKTIDFLKDGTYYLFEVTAPIAQNKTNYQYYLNEQDNYKKNVPSELYNTILANNYMKDNDWVYLNKEDRYNWNDGSKNWHKVSFNSVNRKLIDIQGKVWNDVEHGKSPTYNHLYDKDSESLVKNIKVSLYDKYGNVIDSPIEDVVTTMWGTEETVVHNSKRDGNNKLYSTISTGETGTYSFRKLTYEQLENAYIEFRYDNKNYVVVNYNTGGWTDRTINSKAQEIEMKQEELDDNNLTGEYGDYPGIAVTDLNYEEALRQYYNGLTYNIENINLGLIKKVKPTYNVYETLKSVYIEMNGYNYTYNMKFGETLPGNESQINKIHVPKVSDQNREFYIYPSDAVRTSQLPNETANTDGLKVYVNYEVTVFNNTPDYNISVYNEGALYLDSLINTYDKNRYTLVDDKQWALKDGKYTFVEGSNWEKKDGKEGIANYKNLTTDKNFEKGITKNNPRSTIVTYKITPNALKDLVERGQNVSILDAPTRAEVYAYHEYRRADNVWYPNSSAKNYAGAHLSSNGYYLHKSESNREYSGALYINLKFHPNREITGTVFNDFAINDDTAKTFLGNGVIDANDKMISGVKVELLNSDKTVATLYKLNGQTGLARTETEGNGNYTFEGVIPGYYYIRFTYGDGSQRIVNANQEVTSREYKSTIINYDNEVDKGFRGNSEWYKNIKDNQGSTAIDDLSIRDKWNGYNYVNNKLTNEYGNAVREISDFETYNTTKVFKEFNRDNKIIEENPYPVMNAYTPKIGISIENDKNTEYNITYNTYNINTETIEYHNKNYSGFHFGIVEQPKISIGLKKEITALEFVDSGTPLISTPIAPQLNPGEHVKYLSYTETYTIGAKPFIKIEMPTDLIYGSRLTPTYKITLTNNSDYDYVGDDRDYSNYYKYGNTCGFIAKRPKEVSILGITYNLYSLFDKDTIQKVEETNDGRTKQGNNNPIFQIEDEELRNKNLIQGFDMESRTKIAKGENITVSYKVSDTSLNESKKKSDPDLEYINKAILSRISLENQTTLQSNFEWNLDSAQTITIFPPTGEDRSHVYEIAGVISLVVISIGIIIIKKTVL